MSIKPEDFLSVIAGIGHACSIKGYEEILDTDPKCIQRAKEARYVRKLNDLCTRNTSDNYVK